MLLKIRLVEHYTTTTTMKSSYLSAFSLVILQNFVAAFTVQPNVASTGCWKGISRLPLLPERTNTALCAKNEREVSVYLDSQLDDERVAALFAWVSRAFAGEPEYNNLMLAIAAIFGNLPENSQPVEMAKEALKLLPPEEEPVGDRFSIEERESNSLGAMGAAQWTGQWKTRPHALLELTDIDTIDDWVKTLPRGCKRTIKKALAQNFSVTTKPILGGQPAPHSSLAHFRCVIEHEVRLLKNMYGEDAFFDALAEGVSRYVGTTRMTGDIREYRSASGKVIAIAHEVSCCISNFHQKLLTRVSKIPHLKKSVFLITSKQRWIFRRSERVTQLEDNGSMQQTRHQRIMFGSTACTV